MTSRVPEKTTNGKRKRKRLCLRCSALPQRPGDTPIPHHTMQFETVASYNLARQSEDVSHLIDPGHFVLRYTLSTRVACNYPGRHRHFSGYIARARCGLLIQIGHMCAKTSVENWDEAIGHVRTAEALASASHAIRSAKDLQKEAANAVRRASGLLDRMKGDFAWKNDAREIPDWFVTGSRTVRVEGRRQTIEDRAPIHGRSIWYRLDTAMKSGRVLANLVEVANTDAQAVKTPAAAKRVSKRFSEAEAHFAELARWLDEGDRFFQRENLKTIMQWWMEWRKR